MLCRSFPFAFAFTFFPFLLLSLNLVLNVEGVFKLLDENADIVNNPKDDVVYLFMFPRTSTTPSQAACNLMVETWLHWKKIPFHRINNQVYLGSKSHGTAPFAYFNGKYIDGSVEIIKTVGNHFQKYEKSKDENTLIKKVSDMFNILMVDRAISLDWMVKDEGLVEVMMSQTNDEMSFFDKKITGSQEFWKQYFDAYNAKEKEEATLKDWNEFNQSLRDNQISQTMKKIKDNEAKLKIFLNRNKLEGKKVISAYSANEVRIELTSRLDYMKEELQKNEFKSLHEEGETLPDAALFGVLVQYFETKLNLFDDLIHKGKYKILSEFTKNVKNSLNLPKKVWKGLTKRPWQLNFDTEYIFDFTADSTKYNGPYSLQAGDLLNIEECVGSTVSFECPEGKLPAEVLESAKALLEKAMKSEEKSRHCHARALIGIMAAYMCNVGTAEGGKACEKTHLDNATAAYDEMKQSKEESEKAFECEKKETRQIVFRTINAYNDAKTDENVHKAIVAVKGKLAEAQIDVEKATADLAKAQADLAKQTDLAKAKENMKIALETLVSPSSLTNEY